MSRKLSKKAIAFALVWGEVKGFTDEEWQNLVELRNALMALRETVTKKREPRKAKPTAEVKP